MLNISISIIKNDNEKYNGNKGEKPTVLGALGLRFRNRSRKFTQIHANCTLNIET